MQAEITGFFSGQARRNPRRPASLPRVQADHRRGQRHLRGGRIRDVELHRHPSGRARRTIRGDGAEARSFRSVLPVRTLAAARAPPIVT